MTAATVSEEELRQLRNALDPRAMEPHLAALIAKRDPTSSLPKGARCRVTDAKYDPGKGCSIVYRIGGRIALGRLRWRDGEPVLDPGAYVTASGVSLTLFPDDPAMPNLRRALDPGAMSSALAAALPECREGWKIVQCTTKPVRYRPSRRCTLRIDLWLRAERDGTMTACTLYGKVYHDIAKAASVFDEMQQLSDAAASHPSGLTLAAPAAFLPDLPMVLQRPVSGTPLVEFFGRPARRLPERAREGVEQSAAALAMLQELGVKSDRERPARAELRKMERRARSTAMVDEKLGYEMERLVNDLDEKADRLGIDEADMGLVQGDCKPDQFLLDGRTTTILDFDHCGTADPATDVATFLATLRQLRIRAALKSPQAAAAVTNSRWLLDAHQTFLDQYSRTRGDEVDFGRRAVWYEAQALLRKAQRGFARSIRSRLPAALIEEAWRCLDAALPRRAGVG
jgi:aminoglycoside phosphotransferase (APT) family kinase protein